MYKYIDDTLHFSQYAKANMKQRNATKSVLLENYILPADEIKIKAIYLFYIKLTYSEN